MECHKREHRASARCVSALLAAGALLATAAGQFGEFGGFGGSSGPMAGRSPFEPAAVGIPQAPPPAPSPVPASAAEKAPDGTPVLNPQPRKTAKRPVAAKKATPKKAPPKKAVTRKAPPKKSPANKPPAKHTKPIHSSPLSHLPAAANPKAAKAVREALSLIGVPYRWGGTTRAGFDCSGFTQHVWAAAGVKIPRTVTQQAAAGTPVPLSRAQPGDLVVFYPSRHHVGVYIGNGLVVDSPHSGSHVRTDPVRSMPVSIVVRPHT
ncbi:MAG: hypothetical protein HOW97_20820 [Catenulispora sp.]|nr:hypothetical protein [Catenulispora sp.]